MGGNLSTGVPSLDRRLDGGLNAGDILAIVAPPATQIQTLMYQLMKKRPTVYVTTLRAKSSIQRDMEIRENGDITCYVEEVGHSISMDNDALRELTGTRTYDANTAVKDNPLDDLYEIIESLDETCNVVIDPMNPLERGEDRDTYIEVLKKLSVTLQEVGGIGVLHCSTLEEPPPFRGETLMVADVVWELDVVETAKSNVEYQLRVPKNRGGTVVLEVLSLEMGKNTVTIDDSRKI